ncbi:hypothetical protein [Parabacteroides faecis]|uniref:Uncharacterized protein n=1 Tax=Parabacteroides faecis TaxID=1217282 RepID=A0ABR6KRJ7_9BACT|nr:hypothetical protein [Parabacteroides faecis]MBB4623413.1 hypothetical protein [Parabacteroides faecis]
MMITKSFAIFVTEKISDLLIVVKEDGFNGKEARGIFNQMKRTLLN